MIFKGRKSGTLWFLSGSQLVPKWYLVVPKWYFWVPFGSGVVPGFRPLKRTLVEIASGGFVPLAEASPRKLVRRDAVIELSKSAGFLCKTGAVLRFGDEICAAR